MNREQKTLVKSARILQIKYKYLGRKIKNILKNLKTISYPTYYNEDGN